MCNWPEQRLQPPEPKEKTFKFEGYAWVKVSGVIRAIDRSEALDALNEGIYDDIDYDDIENIEVEELEEEE